MQKSQRVPRLNIPANLLGSPLLVVPGVKIHLGDLEEEVEAVHCVAKNSSHDGCQAPVVPIVDAGQDTMFSSKEQLQSFLVVSSDSKMQSTLATEINFVDVNLRVLEQHLHHIVVAFK